ncbi:MAG: histidine phosphatase family protein [Oscillatoriales cyanobacterium RM2_1_1]|nr:histidine phosphatase family protein [Oscillatoriales cyanobacterium SM2_3_0]NJO44481.1 histidine phosphatase family protein [Oscillatoriales cyanobacterium RM2_1_1]
MVQTVWIARHGNRIDFVNPDWFNTAERPYDPHLSDDGIVQAQQLAKHLVGQEITQIFASPFLRTVQTAAWVAEALDLPLKLDWGLGEWLNPEWMSTFPETLLLEQLAAQFPRITLNHPGGAPEYPETWDQCLKRTGATTKRLVEAFPEDNLLLVGHGASVVGAAKALAPMALQDFQLKVPLCSLFKLVRHHPEWQVELTADTAHLGQHETTIRWN